MPYEAKRRKMKRKGSEEKSCQEAERENMEKNTV
jgi:hypothetical protein